MPEITEIYRGTAIAAADLKGQHVPLTIAEVKVREFDDGKRKLELAFAGTDRTMVLNKVNATSIAGQYGLNYDQWVGKQITLYPTETDYQGKRVPCIRIAAANTQSSPPQQVQKLSQFPSPSPDIEIPF